MIILVAIIVPSFASHCNDVDDEAQHRVVSLLHHHILIEWELMPSSAATEEPQNNAIALGPTQSATRQTLPSS
jgi:hypothetical protein